MSAIQPHARGAASWPEFGGPSPTMRLLDESRLGGVLDVQALADGVSQLAQLNPQGAVQALGELASILAPLDLARLTSDVAGVVTAVGGLVGQVAEGAVGALADVAGGVDDGLGGSLEGLARTTAGLSTDLSRRVDAAAVGLGVTRALEGGGVSSLRPEQIGGGEGVDRALGLVSSIAGRQTLADIGAASLTRTDIGATTGTERTAQVGRNEATWTLDAQGRPVRAEAILREVFTDLERSSAETRAQGEAADRGVEGDHGGHIIGHRFVKDQGLDNLFPQNGDFNISAYKTLENEMADWVEAGAEVRVTVDLLGGGDRPVKVRVAYEVLSAGGDVVYENNVLFRNQADQTFDRTPSSDMKTLLDG